MFYVGVGVRIKKQINWLEPCSNCKSEWLFVETERKDDRLNELDDVSCDCGMTGYIDVEGEAAFVCWDELTESELKYNKLKVMYDKCVHLLMQSNYGDKKYLKRYGAIE